MIPFCVICNRRLHARLNSTLLPVRDPEMRDLILRKLKADADVTKRHWVTELSTDEVWVCWDVRAKTYIHRKFWIGLLKFVYEREEEWQAIQRSKRLLIKLRHLVRNPEALLSAKKESERQTISQT